MVVRLELFAKTGSIVVILLTEYAGIVRSSHPLARSNVSCAWNKQLQVVGEMPTRNKKPRGARELSARFSTTIDVIFTLKSMVCAGTITK